MSEIAALISDHLDTWTAATERKNGAGRGGGKRVSLYGIERLRALILDLALRGKLLPQDASDEPAHACLVQARNSLQDKSNDARRLRWKPSRPFDDEELRRPVPPGWTLARVNDTGLYINGLAFKPADWSDTGRPIIRIQNLTNPNTPYNYAQGDYPDEVVVRDGDLLVSWSATLAAFQWSGEDAILNQHIFKVIHEPALTERAFLRLMLERAIGEMAESDHAHGLVMTHINRGPFLDHLVKVPPLAEQRRIVAKVEELTALCDALEGESAVALTAHKALVETLLATLVNSADAADLAANWTRLEAYFDTLFTTPASVDALKQTILDLAVNGGFSPECRWPQAPVALKSAAFLQNGYAFKSEWFAQDGIRLLRNINIAHGSTDWSETVCLPEKDAEPFSRFLLAEGDIVLTLDRPFISTGTKVAQIVSSDLPSLLLQRVARFQLGERLTPEYVFLWVNSPMFSKQIDPGRSNGVPHISTKQVGAAMIYIPSIDEQRRVVAIVDALLALCIDLNNRVADLGRIQRRLADAVVECAGA